MLIRLGYDIRFHVPFPTPMVTLLNVHASRQGDLQEIDTVRIEPHIPIEHYRDGFGNDCCRFVAPDGDLRLYNSTLIADSGEPNPQNPDAREIPVGNLTLEALPFLLASRYCEVDLLSNTAVELFGGITPRWGRVQPICDWVNQKVVFGYNYAGPTKTALNVYTERVGVCRDFQHLADVAMTTSFGDTLLTQFIATTDEVPHRMTAAS